MVVRHLPPRRTPHVLLRVQIRRRRRKLQYLQARVRFAQRLDRWATVPRRSIPQQQNIALGMCCEQRLQMLSCHLGIQLRCASDDLLPGLEVQRAIPADMRSSRVASHREALSTRRPDSHRRGLQIDLGFIFSQDDRVRRVLSDVNQFFSSNVSNCITAASLRDLNTLVG